MYYYNFFHFRFWLNNAIRYCSKKVLWLNTWRSTNNGPKNKKPGENYIISNDELCYVCLCLIIFTFCSSLPIYLYIYNLFKHFENFKNYNDAELLIHHPWQKITHKSMGQLQHDFLLIKKWLTFRVENSHFVSSSRNFK